ncbi:MAG TPA: V-type ATPase 116kDa subunit family protein [Candidatus Limnocylindrales bacterium]|nr:V-type ATPase 116kDa subunit family protein [Candidatus Limnocylindrales bacterium]
MTLASIICVRQDVESMLEALNVFGEFHIEQSAENTGLAEYAESIQKSEESLSYVNELIKQLSEEKAGMFDIFKQAQPSRIQVTAENWQTLLESTCQRISVLKTQVDELNTSLTNFQEKSTKLNRVKDMLTIMHQMNADLGAIKDLKLIQVTAATVPHKNFDALKTALKDFPLILQRSDLTKENDFITLSIPSKQGADVDKILKAHRAEAFSIPEELPHDASAALNEVNDRLKENENKEMAISSSLSRLSQENRDKLDSWKETTENVLALLNAKTKMLQSGHLATVEGFVPEKKFAALQQKIHDMLGEKAIVLQKELVEDQDPPTALKNNRFVKPFEEITRLYGLPHYDELDPTPFLAITFPILFGLMFGDIGHGLILFVGGLTLFLLIKKNQGIRNVCWIMATCGIAAMVAGALFGEFFGKELFAPLWFSPFNNVFAYLIFSLYVGVAQITSGISLDIANFLIEHNVVDALLVGTPKIAFYLSAVYLITVYKLDIGLWFSGPILLILVPFFFMVFAKPAYVAISHYYSMRPGQTELANETGGGSLSVSLFESGDSVTRLLSNTISYTRILALLMAHWALVLVTYTVAGLIGTASITALILSGIVIIGGNLFVIALEGLIVFIHTMRLHFYEWFTKFYYDSGTQFSPFKQNFVYTDVSFNEKNA